MDAPPLANPPGRGRLLRSFGYAIRGIVSLVATQANARLHAAATLLAVGLGFFLKASAWEWCALLLAIGMVWTAEALNTAIEATVDLVSPDFHPLAKRAKDIAAGGVLCAAVTAGGIGVVIFLPKLCALFGGR